MGLAALTGRTQAGRTCPQRDHGRWLVVAAGDLGHQKSRMSWTGAGPGGLVPAPVDEAEGAMGQPALAGQAPEAPAYSPLPPALEEGRPVALPEPLSARRPAAGDASNCPAEESV